MWFEFRPYVPVAQRRAEAARLTARLQKQGRKISPIVLSGRTIASTFWGKAWCNHLESYSDYENRLPRGRTYVRNGSVIDLQITPGKITALVSGSEVYHINIKIDELDPKRWQAVREQCAGQIGSVLELLQGRFDKSVMAILTDRDEGLFPSPSEISMNCSCPDWAGLCKHLAAVLYGIGSRLDHEPELLFVLRQVDHLDLLEQVGAAGSLGSGTTGDQKTLQDDELAGVFGIDLEAGAAPAAEETSSTSRTRKPRATAKPNAAKVKEPSSSRSTRSGKSKASTAPATAASAKRKATTARPSKGPRASKKPKAEASGDLPR